MSGNLVVGDYGKYIEIPVVDDVGDPFDLSTNSLLKFHFLKPSGTTASVDVTPKVGETTTARYLLEDGDLDEDGDWKVQLEYTIGSEHGRTWPLSEFTVGMAIGQ